MKNKTSIEIKNLSIGYTLKHGKQKVVKEHINQLLYNGEVTCLLGSNGAGKTTLIRTLSGFQHPLQGEILFYGKNIEQYSDSELALKVGLVLTEKTFAGGISVFDLVSLGRHPHTGFFGKLNETDNDIIRQSMEKTGIAHKADAYVSELSDGERQKAMIAKALAQECPIIILDEPTAFLDINSRIETMALLRNLALKENKSILLSTHDIESAIRMSDRFWLMDKNKPFVSGIPEDLILEGIFEDFFNREHIYFDQHTGSFQIREEAEKKIYITGDDTIVYWVKNALRKKDYLAVPGIGFPQIICNKNEGFSFKPSEGLIHNLKNTEDLLNHL